MSESWRLLLTGPGDPGFNMALDEALAIAVRRGWSPPTLRLYQWACPAISLGCHQPLSILRAFAAEEHRGAVVVRRPTGGGAVLHGGDVSYGLACPSAALRGRPGRLLYRQFHEALGRALAAHHHRRYAVSDTGTVSDTDVSETICFRHPVADDLMQGTMKVAGAAQRRWRDGLLQQGTVSDPGRSRDRLALGIRMAWATVFDRQFTVGALTVQERVLADELWRKYRPWTPLSWPPASPRVWNR